MGDRGRRRCPRHCPTAKIIRGNDPHSNFRRGLGSLRTDRGHFPFHQERLNWTRVILSIAAAVVVTEKFNKCSNLQSVEQWRPNPKESGILDYIRFHVSRFYFDIIQNVFCINSVFHAKYQTKLILYRNLTWNIFTGFSTHTTRETIISISAFTFNITQQLVTYFCDLLIVINDTYLVRTNSGAIFNAWFQTIACEHYIPSMRRWNQFGFLLLLYYSAFTIYKTNIIGRNLLFSVYNTTQKTKMEKRTSFWVLKVAKIPLAICLMFVSNLARFAVKSFLVANHRS